MRAESSFGLDSPADRSMLGQRSPLDRSLHLPSLQNSSTETSLLSSMILNGRNASGLASSVILNRDPSRGKEEDGLERGAHSSFFREA